MTKEKFRRFTRRLITLAAAFAICFTLTGREAHASSTGPASSGSTSAEASAGTSGTDQRSTDENEEAESEKTTLTPAAIAIAALMAGGAWLLRRTKGDYRDQR